MLGSLRAGFSADHAADAAGYVFFSPLHVPRIHTK
jgi:hypothetical protein